MPDKMNRKVNKICNDFQKMNLKNQIALKKAIKRLESLKAKDLPCVEKHDEDDNVIDELLLNQCYKDTNLLLCNNNEFKITNKPRDTNLRREFKTTKKKTEIILEETDDAVENIEANIMRVECRHIEHQEVNLNVEYVVKTDEIITENHLKLEEREHNGHLSVSPRVSPRNGFDRQINDLRNLLSMMAISPKSDHETESLDSPKSKSESPQVKDSKTDLCLPYYSPAGFFDEDINISEFLSITTFRENLDAREIQIVSKYAKKWKNYVKKRKELQSTKHQDVLNSFFDKLTKKKQNLLTSTPEPTKRAKLMLNDYNKYQNRYKMQKHIIALQKAKLEEQRRIIEELKYNKIVEASKQSLDDLREEVRKTYCSIDRHLKPKIKHLTNELNIPDIEEPLVLHCLKVPQFLQRMEKRAREREEKHAIIRERRKQMEEERIRIKQQEELSRAAMDKEEKIKRIKDLKDKRKKEKIEGIRKKQHAERMRALTVMAELHYEKTLMAKYGIRPLRILIAIKQDNIEKAKAHYNFQLKKNIFFHWMWYTDDVLFERNFKAENFWRKKLLNKSFQALKKNYHGFVVKKQVAEDYYDLYVTQLVFRKFCEAIKITREQNELKVKQATLYFESNLLFKAFTCWRTLPALNALMREQDARKARWREKVLQVVPDYMPPDD